MKDQESKQRRFAGINLHSIASLIERLNTGVLVVVGVGFFLMMVGNVVDVLLREAANKPVPGIIELSELAIVMITFLGLAYTQLKRAHVSVELLILHLPDRPQTVLKMVGLLLALVFFAFLTYASVGIAHKSILIQEVRYGIIPFPIWPAKLVMPIGLSLLCLQLGVDLFREVGHYRDYERKGLS